MLLSFSSQNVEKIDMLIIYYIIHDELTVLHPSRKKGEVTKSHNHLPFLYVPGKDVRDLV